MRAVLIALLLLSACGREGEEAKQADGEASSERAKTPPVLRADGQPGSLTGLYESGQGIGTSQLCAIEKSGQPTRFALVLRGAGDRSCSGGGTLRREGRDLHFTMAGESTCTFDARLEGRRLVISNAVPSGCSYYCTAGTSLAGAGFTMVAPSVEDALRARDLVGEPLCGTR
ncbi:hypothetical protein [Allosphingosinicella vermicomposti]|uniref:hypothetical protein n=1 Tax=Allosphingosinicella vermicomposti TaxID=614671 RepID=UPI00131A57A5|nr:hypothetical protein [Allosphingosinicella vermicomposti]